MDTMGIFISWSGPKSKKVAEALREFLETILQATKPWVSSTDLVSGDRWNEEISKKLSDSQFGIICLTEHNINAPWVLFEAGALAKSVSTKTYVCPYLVDLCPSQLAGPLALFQAREADKDGTLQLIEDINSILKKKNPDSYLKDERLQTLFEKMWPDFESTLNNLSDLETDKVLTRDSENMVKEDTVKEILEIIRSINSPDSDNNIKGFLEIIQSINSPETNDRIKDLLEISRLINSLEAKDALRQTKLMSSKTRQHD